MNSWPHAATGGAAPFQAASGAGFLFDPNRCTGCAACAVACSTENGLDWGVSWRRIVSFNPERRPGVPSFHLSLACSHCEDAPCVDHCPSGAMGRDTLTAAVVVDEERCIGCRYCAWVCPYDAPRFDGRRGVMRKCTLCNHHLREGVPPACVTACPTEALRFGSLRGEARVVGFPDAPIRPRIRFTSLRRGATPPETSWTLPAEVAAAFAPGGARAASRLAPTTSVARVTLGGEWPLWVFTSGLAGLVGWIAAAALSALRTSTTAAPSAGAVRVPVLAFLLAAAVLMGVASLHLGRPGRAWRALANVRASALSREIAVVVSFLGAAILWLAWGGAGSAPLLPSAPASATLNALGGAAALVGLVALATVDRVYLPVRGGRSPHPADTLLTGPLVAAVLLPSPWLFGGLAVLKVLAAAAGPVRRTPYGAPLLWARAATLVGLVVLWSSNPGVRSVWAVFVVAAVELADRARLYRELAIR